MRQGLLCAAGLVGLGLLIVALSTWRLNYALGDDPGSSYYVADTLVLPERSYNGRSSFLAVVSLDDGTRALAGEEGCSSSSVAPADREADGLTGWNARLRPWRRRGGP